MKHFQIKYFEKKYFSIATGFSNAKKRPTFKVSKYDDDFDVLTQI